MSSCGHDSPQSDVLSTNGSVSGNGNNDTSSGSGQRPGLEDYNTFDKELKDDVLRVKGADINMRYDRGGILFVTRDNGEVRVIDLDGADEVSIFSGTEGADSVMSGFELKTGDRKVGLKTVKMMQRSGGRIWYKAVSHDDNVWTIVLSE